MLNGCQLEDHQTGKPNCTCICYVFASYPTLELVHLVKHNPTSLGKTYYLSISFSFWFCPHFGFFLFLFLLYNNFLPISFLLQEPFYLFLIHSYHFVEN